MLLKTPRLASRLGALLLGTSLAGLAPVVAKAGSPSLNLWGATGLIDLPSAEMQPDGVLNTSYARFGGIARVTLSYQILPRISGSFRYTALNGWNSTFPTTYFDRSFDLRFQILKEHGYLPSLTLGLQDFIGTDLLSAEYLVATKSVTPHLKFTLGLGWGRLGSHGSIGTLFGARPSINFGQGGTASTKQWFRGPAAPFGGLEWQISDRWRFKAEYSSDAYKLEIGQHHMFTRGSSINAGLEYDLGKGNRIGIYELYGTKLGVSLQFALDPQERVVGTIIDGAPIPVKVRPTQAADPTAWSTSWVSQPQQLGALKTSMEYLLKLQRLGLVSLAVTADTAQLAFTNTTYHNSTEAIGRAARALSQAMPASVETFELIPVTDGMPLAKVTVKRSDLERLEFAPDAAGQLAPLVRVTDALPMKTPQIQSTAAAPRLQWSVAPYLRAGLFDPVNPFRYELGVRVAARYRLAPGLFIAGSATKRAIGDLNNNNRTSNSVLPHVRTDYPLYDQHGDPALENLYVAWYDHPLRNIYTRVSAGYLERMFGGISSEVLWQPVGSRFAAGAELDYVRQRDYSIGFAFRPYHVVTGLVSLYYQLPGNFLAQLDAGRYLAGDKGATLTVSREFANGWRVGAFATKTNVSAAQFGEGSFDKGLFFTIPLNWLNGAPSQTLASVIIRPIQRDGGQTLDVPGRLYGIVRAYNQGTLSSQWGRVFR